MSDLSSLEVQGPGGIHARVQGREILLVVLLVAGFLGLAWMMHDHGALSMAETTRILQETRALACVFALPEADRPRALLSHDGPCTYLVTVYGGPSGRSLAPRR